MRTFIVIILWLSATTMIAQEKQNMPDMPFYNKQKMDYALKQQTEYDTVWLPVKVMGYYLDSTNKSLIKEYKYNESGLLQKMIWHYSTGLAEYIYNQTYLTEEEDVLDTVTHYVYDGVGNKIPYQRTIYENYQTDFWYAINDQKWENGQWVTTYMRERYLLDTLNVVGFPYWEQWFSSGVLINGEYNTLEKFDERQNVIELSCQIYDSNIGKYIKLQDNEFLYDENNVCYERHIYREYAGNYILRGKVCWEWEEFHGFLNGDLVYFQIFGKPDYRISNKPTIKSSYGSNDGLSFNLDFMERYSWNIDGNNSAECATYVEWGDSLFRELVSGIYYDEQGNTTGDIDLLMYHPYKYGNYHDTCAFFKRTYINYYNERNRFYKYDFYQTDFDDRFNTGSRDNIYMYTMVVDSFTYVLKKVNIDELLEKGSAELKIVPNPADETVLITAVDSIATITFYTTDGRLAYSQNGSGKEMIVNLHGLSQGIYLVQARLKDGRVQTGKIVVR